MTAPRRIALLAWGSRGDVQPLVPLALALSASGHDVTLATPPEFESWIRGLGIRWAPGGPAIADTIDRIDVTKAVRSILKNRRLLHEIAAGQFLHQRPLIEAADVVVAGGTQFASRSLAEAFGKPYAVVAFCPHVFVSRAHPAMWIPPGFLPEALNRPSWWLTGRVWDWAVRSTVNASRHELGLAPIRDTYRHAWSATTLVASDPRIAPLPEDVPNATQPGPFFFDEPGVLPPELESWLQKGPPPVYVGFGSMTTPRPEEVTRVVEEVVRKVGRRLVLSRGWARLGAGLRDSAELRVIDGIPHHLLFPRMAAVVHHGGAGTVHAALRAGVPQVLVPHLLDQFYWAHRLVRSGCAAFPLPRIRFTAARFGQALAQALEPSLAARARELGEATSLQGVSKAAAIVASLAD